MAFKGYPQLRAEVINSIRFPPVFSMSPNLFPVNYVRPFKFFSLFVPWSVDTNTHDALYFTFTYIYGWRRQVKNDVNCFSREIDCRCAYGQNLNFYPQILQFIFDSVDLSFLVTTGSQYDNQEKIMKIEVFLEHLSKH